MTKRGPFLLCYSVFVFSLSLFFVSMLCARLNWLSHQLLSTDKYTISYRKLLMKFTMACKMLCMIMYCYGITCTDVSSDDDKPVIAVDSWITQAEVKTTFECQEVTSNGYTYPRSLLRVFVFQLYLGKSSLLFVWNNGSESAYDILQYQC